MVAVGETLPELPLLAPWYRLVEQGERLVLEHGGRVLSLEGAAVTRLLPRLLPLLDGTRTVREIVELVGEAVEPATMNALALLAERRLLVDGPLPDCGRELRETVDWLAAGADVPPATVAGRLADARVAVLGDGVAAAEAARLLRRSGVARIGRGSWSWSRRSRAELTIVAPSAGELERVLRWNDLANEHGLRWLPVLPYDGRLVAIGPLVVPGETACFACLRLRQAASLGIGELADALSERPVAAGGGPALAVAAGAVAALHALRWVALADAELPGVLHALEGPGPLRLTAHPVLRVPRCPACSERRRTAAPLPWFQPSTRADCS